MKTKHLIASAVCVGLLGAAQVQAAEFWVSGKIVRTLNQDARFGECMIQLDRVIGGNCPNNGWVSLDCAGAYTSKDTSKRFYATALTAFSLDKKVSVYVSDANKHNDYCTVRRIDMFR